MTNLIEPTSGRKGILLCFSHLRWHFVYQRPQHLLSRAANDYLVYFIEEPVFVNEPSPKSPQISKPSASISVVVPFISESQRADAVALQRDVVTGLIARHPQANIVTWYYTPMALPFTKDVNASVTVYDCMDELSGFLGAPPELMENERALFQRADLVFTGGRSLYEAKKSQHHSTHAFPSSIDKAHFTPARNANGNEPADQAAMPRPRVGYFGVIDERMNLGLVDELARTRPQWQFIMLGPVVKIDPANLPRRQNIHWIGSKAYSELPAYLSGWDAGFMPFALNDATRYISPTKTPEFLAAGVPVVSTSIADVIDPYGKNGLVGIADEAEEFASALEVQMSRNKPERLAAVDAFLSSQSWDATWASMQRLIDEVRSTKDAEAADAA